MRLKLIILAAIALMGCFQIARFLNDIVVLPVFIYLLVGYSVIGLVVWITWQMWKQYE